MRSHVFVGAICISLFQVGLTTIAQEISQVPFATSKIDFGMVGLDGEAFAVTSLQTSSETVQETYAVEIPYQETVDGTTVTRTRSEQRTRDFTRKRLVPVVTKVPAEAVAFSSAAGKHIADLSVVRKALASPRAAVITYSAEPLENYYRQILNPSTVVIHIDQSKLARKAPTPAPIPDSTGVNPLAPAPAPVLDPAFAPAPSPAPIADPPRN